MNDVSRRVPPLQEAMGSNRVHKGTQWAETLDLGAHSVTGGKAHAVEKFQEKAIVRFNPEHAYPQGCTDYDRWQPAQVRLTVLRQRNTRCLGVLVRTQVRGSPTNILKQDHAVHLWARICQCRLVLTWWKGTLIRRRIDMLISN